MNLYKVLFLLLLSFKFNISKAQTKIDSILKPQILMPLVFQQNHFGINIFVGSVQRGNVIGNSSAYNQNASNNLGLQVSLLYNINFSNKYALNTGVGFALLGRNFNYSIPKENFTPILQNDLTNAGLFSQQSPIVNLSVPLSLEHRWLKHKHFFSFSTGIDFAIKFQSYNEKSVDIYNNNGNLIPLVEFNTDWESSSIVNVGPLIGFSYGFLTKKRNIKKISLISRLSFNEMAKSTYTFTVPNQTMIIGEYYTKGSYLGIQFSYLFTGTNKSIRKIFEN